MFLHKEKLVLIILLLCAAFAKAQVHISAEEAVESAMSLNPQLKAAILEIERSKELEKASVNIPNPELLIESTTGKYQTAGFIQSFDFPSVYAKQRSVGKQFTELSKIGSEMTEAEVEARIRIAYLDIQYYSALAKHYQKQDSLFSSIAKAAERKFSAGEIDALAASYAKLQGSEVHRISQQSATDSETAVQTLQILMNRHEDFITDELKEADELAQVLQYDSLLIHQSLTMKQAESTEILREKQLSLERNKTLPGFAFGYLNPAESDTPFEMRLRGGITIPLWWWQYSGNIKAAKTGLEIAKYESLQAKQNLSIRVKSLLNDYRKYKSSLHYFETEGDLLIAKMKETSQRLFEAGSIDYITHLRNLNDAYAQEQARTETLYLLNKTLIQLNYITRK